MAMVEGRLQAQGSGGQHAVAEHVAAHIADGYRREGLGLTVAPRFPEMTLHAFPGAASGDAHGLVVVAGRAAGGESIVQPEVIFARQAVGDIRERGRALVGGHHQIRIGGVAGQHAWRRDNLVADAIVGDIKQAADEDLVTGDAPRGTRLAVYIGGQILQHEAALGPDRHNDRVLDHLRFHQTQNLGPKVLEPV